MSNTFTQVNLLLGVFLVRRRLFRFLLWTLRFPALHHFFCCYLNLSWRWGISAFALRFFIACLRPEKIWLSLVLLFAAFEQTFDSETQKCCFPWANFLLQCLKNEQSIKGKHCGFKKKVMPPFLGPGEFLIPVPPVQIQMSSQVQCSHSVELKLAPLGWHLQVCQFLLHGPYGKGKVKQIRLWRT